MSEKNQLQLPKKVETTIKKAIKSFPYFIEHIFPYSYSNPDIVESPHTHKWGERIQANRLTATLSARKHLKSTTMYAWVMWKLFRLKNNRTERGLYMSYNQKMSIYHTENIKLLIQANHFFKDIKDNTKGSSQIDYSWNDTNRFITDPSGILTFNRGWHGAWVVADDILQDPTSELVFTIIDKINRVFMEQVMSLPIEGGELHLVGTSQHTQDLFFKLQNNPSWDWAEYKAIANEGEEKVLWPELFHFKRLTEIRRNIGDKAFNREYQCSPVWSEDAYFRREELMEIVSVDNPETGEPALKEVKRPAGEWKAGIVIAGVDIGKKAHPSHIAIFEKRQGFYIMIYQVFLDGWDYTKQIEFIKGLKEFYLIDEIRYDNTRGEFEPFAEQRQIDTRVWRPIIFTNKNKFQMASNFSKHVNNKTVKLLNNQRMVDSVLSVNNDLQAPETEMGHGDAFWSVAMALYEPPTGGGYISI